MYSPEQITTVIEQNQKLMEQNQQLIGLLSQSRLPVVPAKKVKKPGIKDVRATQITNWYYASVKNFPPIIATILMAKLKSKGVWKG